MRKDWIRQRPATHSLHPIRARLIWTIGNLLLFTGIYLLLLVGGISAQESYHRLAARGDNDLPLPEKEHNFLRRVGPYPIAATHETTRPLSGTSTIEQIIISTIAVDSKVIPVNKVWETDSSGNQREVWEVARYAVGHHRGSANPGEHENIVLSGHVGGYSEVFRDLKTLKAGDMITINANGKPYRYAVTEQWLLEEEGATPEQRRINASYLDPTGAEMVTLVSCWPPEGPEKYHQRVVVRALPIHNDSENDIKAVPTSYYVAPQGNDKNPGNDQKPFATIANALKYLLPGDTLFVRAGTYTLDDVLWIDHIGSVQKRITLRAFPGESVILECNKTKEEKSCFTINGRYIDIIGFEIVAARWSGIGVWGGAHIRILNNTIHHAYRAGVYVGYDSPGYITDIIIDGNTIYRNAQSNNPPPAGTGSGWPSGIGVFFTTYATITNNLVYNNYGEGIIMGLMDHGIASGNTVYDNYSVGMYMDNATHITYQNNFIFTTNNPEFFRYGLPSPGIQMANETYGHSNPISHNQVFNNIVVGASKAFSYGNYQEGGGLQYVTVANNTFYQGQDVLINIDNDSGHQNTLFVNNIFYQVGDRPIIRFPGNAQRNGAIRFYHNNWFGGDPGEAGGEGDIIGNPSFYYAGGDHPKDYILTFNSPLPNAGIPVGALGEDYQGIPRPSRGAYDIGAYEWPDRYSLFFPLLTIAQNIAPIPQTPPTE